MRCERKILGDDGIEPIKQMSAGRDFEPGRELASDRRTAHARRRFQHEHLAAGARKIRSADETIVPAADDDDLIVISHRPNSPVPSMAVADPSALRERRWLPALP